MNSIRARLTLWYTGILALTFAMVAAYVLFALRSAAEETIDTDLQARIGTVRAHLLSDMTRGPIEVVEELEEEAGLGPSGAWVQIRKQGGEWLYRSPALQGLSGSLRPGGIPSGPGVRGRKIRARGKELREMSADIAGYTVEIGEPMDEFDEMFRRTKWALMLASPVLLAMAAAGGYWMSSRALAPVNGMAKAFRAIGAKSLSERLPVRGTGDELDQISVAANETLTRLEASFNLVTRFTADASHELRTPLGIMRTIAEVIRSHPRTIDEHEAAWDQAIVQTSRMSALIDDLLVLARADAGRAMLHGEPVDLAAIVGGVVEEMRIVACSAGLDLKCSLPAKCFLDGDSDALRRVAAVLLDNAIKYTRRGGSIGVTVACGTGEATLEVRDTGIGIAPEHLSKIFHRFYRVAQDRSRSTGGAGLGLSIAQHLVALHGGEISAESAPGRGAAFRVRIPIPREADSAILQNSAAHSNA